MVSQFPECSSAVRRFRFRAQQDALPKALSVATLLREAPLSQLHCLGTLEKWQ